jgi:hypothetical protein
MNKKHEKTKDATSRHQERFRAVRFDKALLMSRLMKPMKSVTL